MSLSVGRRSAKLALGVQPLSFPLPEGEPRPAAEFDGKSLRAQCCGINVELQVEVEGEATRLRKALGAREHVLGLGTRAYPVDRRRGRFVLWNHDNYAYQRGMDPLYASIPLLVFVEGGRAFGLAVNSPAYGEVDVGHGRYRELQVYLEDRPELYLLFGPTPLEVYEAYAEVTGRPFLPPRWALGLHLSRYSYEPQEAVLEVVDSVSGHVPVEAVYLDIDHMDRYKPFTWDWRKFPDPRGLAEELHARGVRVVPIVDPYIKAEPGYGPFERMLHCLALTENGELYLARGWPGLSGLPDLLDGRCRELWAREVEEYVRRYDVDGLWIDMNEPTVFNCDAAATASRMSAVVGATPRPAARDELRCKAPVGAYHRLDGGLVPHERVRGLFPYFEAEATYRGLERAGKRPFVLSRAGYLGIQKYAALWTGDVPATWEGLRLTLSVVLGLSASGVPLVGCDVGGFAGLGDHELTARWYQAAAFFPLYRVHGDKGTPDRELAHLPAKYRKMAVEAVHMRYRYMPYLWHLAWEAHLTGRPMVRPLGLEFPDDEDAFAIDDQYMVGPHLLYAPILDRGARQRDVYLPRGAWLDLATGKRHVGPSWVVSEADMPLYIRWGSAVPTSEELLIFGEGNWTIYHGDEGPLRAEVRRAGDAVEATGLEQAAIHLLGESLPAVRLNGTARRTEATPLGVRIL